MRNKRKTGRPRVYDYNLKKGQFVSVDYSPSARASYLSWGLRNNVLFTTKKEGDKLVIKRIL